MLAAETPTTLNIQLKDDFAKQVQCKIHSGRSLKFWLDKVEDARASKTVAMMMNAEEIPLQSTQPMAEVVAQSLREGFKKCGLTLVGDRSAANVWVTPKLETFSGTSQKGWLKGKINAEAQLTLTFVSPKTGTDYSEVITVEEEQKKGISKKPKKIEEMLNSLLTRLTLQVFESTQANGWLAEQ